MFLVLTCRSRFGWFEQRVGCSIQRPSRMIAHDSRSWRLVCRWGWLCMIGRSTRAYQGLLYQAANICKVEGLMMMIQLGLVELMTECRTWAGRVAVVMMLLHHLRGIWCWRCRWRSIVIVVNIIIACHRWTVFISCNVDIIIAAIASTATIDTVDSRTRITISSTRILISCSSRCCGSGHDRFLHGSQKSCHIFW